MSSNAPGAAAIACWYWPRLSSSTQRAYSTQASFQPWPCDRAVKQYRHSTAVTELRQFENRGHSLTIDSGWKDIADATLEWLKAQGL